MCYLVPFAAVIRLRSDCGPAERCSLTIEEADAGLSEPSILFSVGSARALRRTYGVVESTTGLCGRGRRSVRFSDPSVRRLSAENLKRWKVA